MIRYRHSHHVFTLSAGYLVLQLIANELWQERPGLLLLLQLPVSALSTVLLFQASFRTNGSKRRFWLSLSAGSLCYFAAETIWVTYAVILHKDPPIPGVADYIWNLQALLFLVGLCILVFSKSGLLIGLRFGFDTLLLMLMFGLFSWEFILQPNYEVIMSSGNWGSMVSALIYPVTDFAITCTLVILLTNNKALLPLKSQLFIMAGFLLFVVADTGYFLLVASEAYGVGDWVDPVYSAGLFMFGFAGLYFEDTNSLPGEDRFRQKAGVWSNSYLFPNLCSLMLAALLIHHIRQMDLAIIGSFAAFLLILLRQGMVTYENRTLTATMASVWRETDFMANHDSLSKLPNRRYFEKRLNEEIARRNRLDGSDGERFAVLFLDLNRFKFINDSLGHSVGDSLIRSVAGRLMELSDERHFIARLGGDEYTVLITGVESFQEIPDFMERIHKAFAPPFQLGTHTVTVTTSIGASVCPEHGVTASDLMKNADAAMYKAKTFGSGKGYIFTADLERQYQLKAAMERDLHLALEREEFLVHYQPQVRAKDGKVIGVEALVRWRSAGSNVSPGDFIPLAEETGLIVDIGEWVLRTSCRQAADWLKEERSPFSLSVNVSPRQLEQAGFVNSVKSILKETGFPSYLLILEITESFAIQDNAETVERLLAIKQMGVQIFMDDFGTGYSSLNHLQRFRVDGLKIAQSFISRITDIREQGVIVKAILAMADSLQLTVVAEGVETEEQYRFLKEMGCDVIQGYYFFKPMPAPEAAIAMEGGMRPASAS